MRSIKRLALALVFVLAAAQSQAATVTFGVGTPDTGATPNVSGAFTPAVGDILVVFVTASATVQATATLTSSAGYTFTQVGRIAYATNVNSIYSFVQNQLVTAAASQTVTFDTASDAATGTVIHVYRISGITRTGMAAILQTSGAANQAAGTTPAATFGSAVNTANPTLGVVGNNSNPATISQPTGWTETTNSDQGYATPATGQETTWRDSGFTGTTITWFANSTTVYGVAIIELDTSSPPSATCPSRALLGVGC